MNEDAICAYVCRLVGIWLERRILTRSCDAIATPEEAISKLFAGESVVVAGGEITRLSLLVDGEKAKLAVLSAEQK